MSRWKLAAVITMLGASAARADDVGFQVETSVASSYIYRGIVQYSTRRAPSSQSTAAVRLDHLGPGSLTLTAWNATALADFSQQPGNAVELDLSATYTGADGPLAYSAGYAAYLYPNHADGAPLDGAHELFGTVAYTNDYIVPTAGIYLEPIRQQGVYVMVAGTHDFHAGGWTLSPTISLGAATYRKYLGGDQSAGPHLNDATAALAARYGFAGGVYAVARVSYALRGTPSELVPMAMDWSFDGRSSIFGALAVGVAR